MFPELVGNGLYGYAAEGYWIDIGTPERYLEATWDLLAGRVESTLPPRDETGSLVYEGCLIVAARTSARSACSAATARSARLARRALGAARPRAWSGADAAVVESVLAEGVRVGERARVEPGAIVGAGAVIGDGRGDRQRGPARRAGGARRARRAGE